MTQPTATDQFTREAAAAVRDGKIALAETASSREELEAEIRESNRIVERAVRQLRAALR